MIAGQWVWQTGDATEIVPYDMDGDENLYCTVMKNDNEPYVAMMWLLIGLAIGVGLALLTWAWVSYKASKNVDTPANVTIDDDMDVDDAEDEFDYYTCDEGIDNDRNEYDVHGSGVPPGRKLYLSRTGRRVHLFPLCPRNESIRMPQVDVCAHCLEVHHIARHVGTPRAWTVVNQHVRRWS